MANQQVGLQAVFEVGGFNNGLQTYLRGVVQAQAQTTQAASAINSAGSSIAAGFGAALGTVAIDAIQGFVRGTVDAISGALELASAFEQLEFGIRALGASQELLAGSTEDFGQIFDDQKEVAQGYLLLLQDLAIPSIFTTQQIASGQRMLQVFGFAQDEAFELNKSLINFATAGNLSAETMGRIAYAMGQVKSEGRLLSTEVRQFSNAGIPLVDILANKLGKSSAQIREQMKEGLLTADVVFPALIDYLSNFSGVTDEAENTLRGLSSALQDVREISVANFTRAALAPILPVLQPIIDFLKDESIRAGATALGELLGPKLASALQAGITALQGMLTAITSISPQTATFLALLAGGAAVLTTFAGAAGIISLAIGALVTPFTLAVGAVSAFVAAYATNFGNVATITNTVVNAVASTINNAVGGFNDFASGIAEALNAAAQAMGDFLGNVAEWGSAIVSTLAEGITAAVSVVIDAINVLAEAMAYLMAPGSPPRMLPHLTEWGKETAEEWLRGWTQADFSILGDITNFVEQVLGKDVSPDKLIAVNETIAQAINEITKLGQVSESTFARIQSSLGSTSDEVFGYLQRYQLLANATKVAEDAQNRLNATTERYDAILSPLKTKLDQATEAVTRAKEAQEAKGLERLLQTAGVSDLRKQEALARLQQIGARQQVADVETERNQIVGALQKELDTATKIQEQAQAQLDLFQQRIQVQTQYIQLLEQEANKASAGGGAAAKKHKEGLTALEQQLKAIQLQQQELQDVIAAAKARKVLEDENATAAQKAAAALELQAIAIRQQQRDIEAAKFGVSLEQIRQIQIVAADLEKGGGKSKIAALASDFKVLTDADPEGRLAKFREEVDKMKLSFDNIGNSVLVAAVKANAGLPVFLRFFNEPGTSGPPPLIANLTAALVGLAAFKFTAVIAGLLSLGPAGQIAAVGIGAFVAAFQGNWFGIRDAVEEVVPIVRARFEELRNIFQQGFTGAGPASISDQLRSGGAIGGFTDQIDNLTFKIGQFAAKVVEDVAKIGPAFAQMKTDLDTIFGGEGTIFSKLTEAAGTISEAFGDNSAVRLALGTFTTFLATTFRTQIVAAGSVLLGMLGPIGAAALAIAGLYTAWVNNIGGIKTYVETNFPGVGTAITTVIDTISAAFQGAIDLIAQFKKDLDNLNLFGGAGGEAPATVGEGLGNLSQRLAEILNKTINDSVSQAADLLIKGGKSIEESGKSEEVGEAVGKAMVNIIGAALVEANKSLQKQDETLKNDQFTKNLQEIIVTFFTGSLDDLKGKGNEIYDAVAATSDVVGIFMGITAQFFAGIADGISTRVGEIITENEAKLLSISNDISDAIANFLNQIIEAGNRVRTFFGFEALKKIEIPIELSPQQFKVITPAQVDLSKAIEVTGQKVLDGAQLIRVNEQNKLALDASVLAQLDPKTKLNLPAGSLIEINGQQKLLVDPSQVFQTETGAQIVLSPSDIITIDKAKPIDIGEIDLSVANVKVDVEQVKTSFSDRLRSETIGEGAAGVEITVDPVVGTPLTAADFTESATGTVELTVEPTVTTPLTATDVVGSSTFGVDLGTDIGAGVVAGYEGAITGGLDGPTQAAIDAAAAAVGAQSPSTVAAEKVGIPIGQGVIQGATQIITTTQTVLTDALNAMLTTMRVNINSSLLLISTDMSTFHTNTLATWTGWAASIQTVIANTYTLLSASTTTWAADMLSQYVTLRTNLESTVRDMTSSVLSLFRGMHSAVISELNAMIREIISKLKQLVEDIRSEFVDKGEELGRDFADGIVDGMKDMIDKVYDAGKKLGEAAAQGGKDGIQAESPSRVARNEIGQPFGQGTVLGILDSIPQAIQAAQSLVQSALASASHALYDSSGHSGSATTINNVKHYHLNVQSQQASRGITYDFGIMQLLEGG